MEIIIRRRGGWKFGSNREECEMCIVQNDRFCCSFPPIKITNMLLNKYFLSDAMADENSGDVNYLEGFWEVRS